MAISDNVSKSVDTLSNMSVFNCAIDASIADSSPTHNPDAATAGEAAESDGPPIASLILLVTEPAATPFRTSTADCKLVSLVATSLNVV